LPWSNRLSLRNRCRPQRGVSGLEPVLEDSHRSQLPGLVDEGRSDPSPIFCTTYGLRVPPPVVSWRCSPTGLFRTESHGTLLGHLRSTTAKNRQQGPTTKDPQMPRRHGAFCVEICCGLLRNIDYDIDIKGLKIPSLYSGPGSNPGSGTISSVILPLFHLTTSCLRCHPPTQPRNATPRHLRVAPWPSTHRFPVSCFALRRDKPAWLRPSLRPPRRGATPFLLGDGLLGANIMSGSTIGGGSVQGAEYPLNPG